MRLRTISIAIILFLSPTGLGYHPDTPAALFPLTRQFETTPSEGIILLSVELSNVDLLLNDGETDEVSFSYVFTPPSDAQLSDYSLSFSCDNDLVYSSSSCTVSSIIATIETTSDTVYNTTVSCIFNRFPGTTECNLVATLDTANTEEISSRSNEFVKPGTTVGSAKSFFEPALSLSNNSELQLHKDDFALGNIAVRQNTMYTSDAVVCNIYGVVFYLLDSFGERGPSSTIVSGLANSYKLSSFDRTDAGVREIQIYSLVPGGASISGSAALTFFSTAVVSLDVSDYIFRYDTETCSLTDASVSEGQVALPSSDSCGIGVAVDGEGSDPVLGVHFRTYKSGNLSVSLTWSTLGTSIESYEQTILFEITEAAPPVISAVSKLNSYRSTPCESEVVTLTAYNVRYADMRQLVVTNDDGTTSLWSEVTQSFSYDSISDSSSIVFESAGGSGTAVPFELNCTFDSDTRSGIVLGNSPVLTLSFSSPPSLSSMTPTTSSENGGETIVLSGSFDGFGDDDVVYVGGYEINGDLVNLTGTNQLSFFSPALDDVGKQYSYDVVVAICAEKSEGITLTYSVPPNVTITSSNSSPNDDGAYIVPSGGSSIFVAVVTGNNDGLLYAWQIFQSDGSQLSISETSDEEVFVVTEDMISTDDEVFVLRVEVINSLNLADFDEVSIQLTTSEYISANVYETSDVLYRSTDVTTLVQSEVTSSSDSGIVLEWSYSGETYTIDSNSVFAQQFSNDSSTTGPSKLGLEFNIARRDLQVGFTVLTLTAYLESNPSIRDTDNVTIRVEESPLRAVINGGINGTLIAAGSDIRLSAAGSRDPDILEDEDSTGMSYQWGPCIKSLDFRFKQGTEDCNSVFPSDVSSEVVSILGTSLVAELLDDNSTVLNPTFFLFGLQISKGSRIANSYLYFEVRRVSEEERIPALTSLDFLDTRGNILDSTDLDVNADIIIQPFAAESIVEWHFDMLQKRHRYLFAVSGALKVGSGFVSSRNVVSRLPLGFVAGALEPATEYTVVVTAVAQDTSIETEYHAYFRTTEVPKLTCNPPQIQTGIVSSTSFTVTASLSFQSHTIDYCFYLISQSNERFPVGKGCSFVPFATFTFPREGVFSIECVAKASSGSEIDKVLLSDTMELFPPPISVDLSQIDYLSERLANYTSELDRCEARRDHACVRTLIMSSNDFSLRVERAVALDPSQEGLDLLERCKAYIANLAELSDSLASQTVLRPNEVEQSIDQSLYLAHVPNVMISDEEVLYLTLSQVNGVVRSVSSGESDAIKSDGIVDKVTSISNLTLTKAYNLDQGGTTRSRLKAQQGAPLSLYATLLFPLIRNIWSIRLPQEVCGYRGFQMTEYPSSLQGVLERTGNDTLDALPAIKLFTGIACDRDQLSSSFGNSFQVKVCQDAVSNILRPRVEIVVAGVPEEIVAATRMATDISPYIKDYVYVALNGQSSLPNGCLELTMERKRSSLTTTIYDNLTAGVLTNLTVPSPSRCTQDTCYRLMLDDNRTTTFTSQQILVTTAKQGLHVAGNITTRAPIWYNDNIEGVTGSTAVATGLAIFGIFVVVSGLVTWIAATTCVVVLPGVDEVGWEYVERDMFGRGSVEDALGPTSASTMAEGATVGSTFTALARQRSTEAYERKSTNMLYG